MINSRLISDLTFKAQDKFALFVVEAGKVGLIWRTHYIITSTFRDNEYQEYLYSLGRTRPGNIVTWTLDSRHKYGTAWDIAILKSDGTIDWSVVKADVDKDDLPDYLELANVGKNIGLECGYFWEKQDAVHYQLRS